MFLYNAIVVSKMYLTIEASEFEKWIHGYVNQLYAWAEHDKVKALEYLEKSDNRSWWKIFEPTKEEYNDWAAHYFHTSKEYDREAKKMLMLIYEEY